MAILSLTCCMSSRFMVGSIQSDLQNMDERSAPKPPEVVIPCGCRRVQQLLYHSQRVCH